MENQLITQLQVVMPAGMEIPVPIKQLYEWIESRELYIDTKDGARIGFLYPQRELKESWTDAGRAGGTEIEFAAEGSVNLQYWFGAAYEEVDRRLCVFAQTGAEGSMGAFWLSEENELKIVHLGSGSGSVLNCILADNAIDFLRLLAIGYDEICWDDEFALPPNILDKEFVVAPNHEFQAWVKDTFKVDIPDTALAIVRNPAKIGDPDTVDAFCLWCQKLQKDSSDK